MQRGEFLVLDEPRAAGDPGTGLTAASTRMNGIADSPGCCQSIRDFRDVDSGDR